MAACTRIACAHESYIGYAILLKQQIVYTQHKQTFIVQTADSGRAGSFLLYLPTVYHFLSRLFALRRKRQSMIKLPCNKCNGCVSSSSHRLKSAGALLLQLRPALYLPVAATTSNRVRQMDRRNDTAPLNRKCDHCLRSPHWTHSVSAHWGPHKTSTALVVPANIYTLRARLRALPGAVAAMLH